MCIDRRSDSRGCKAAEHIRLGMPESAVTTMLGDDCHRVGHGPGYYDLWYLDAGIIVSFDSAERVIGINLANPSPPTTQPDVAGK